MNDGLVHALPIIPPLKGLNEGLDPALPDEIYPPAFSPDLENIRVAEGRWQTRLGMTLLRGIGGTGDVRLLADFYTAAGGRFRLAAQGTNNAAELYDFEEGVDAAFQATSGGTGLGGSTEPYFQGVIQNDRFYFTDRAGAFRRYEPAPSAGNQVRSIAQPTAPGAAPLVTPRIYKYLETWPGAEPFGWTESTAADFDFDDDSSAFPAPDGGKTVKLSINNSTAPGDRITENVSGEVLNSRTIAFWLRCNSTKVAIQFQWGVGSATDFSDPLKVSKPLTWLPHFVNVSGTPTINFKRFLCVEEFDSDEVRIGKLHLPGRLFGQYRWVYTHYDPTTGRESQPSPITNSGAPMDFSLEGANNEPTTVSAFKRAAAISVVSDSGSDTSTTQMRIYRNGGTPSLTVDSRGRTVWYRVGTISDVSTQLNEAGGISAGDTSFDVDDASDLAVGDCLVLDKGTVGTEEFVVISSIASNTITIQDPLEFAHADNATVQVAFLDNTPNELVDTSASIDLERGDPPSGVRFVGRSPDGRLWLFGNTSKPTQVCVSNRATPERPQDYEVFPDNVDPLTRKNPLQGWRFEIGGDANDEEIVWGGFYRDVATILTRRNLYTIQAASQQDWGALSVQKMFNVGCIAGDTVAEVNGVLYWVADGPRVVRWDGSGPPQDISHNPPRINVRLNNAPTTLWKQWFARYHAKREGPYYCLYFTPSGATTNTQRLDYNVTHDAWEPVVYYTSGGTAIGWRAASVRAGGSDVSELYQVDTSASIFQAESGSTDNSEVIRIRAATKKFKLAGDAIGLAHQAFVRLSAVTDTLTLTIRVGGSEYGDVTQTYTLTLNGSEDKEIKKRLHRTLLGRWIQVQISGSVSNRPAVREMMLWYLIHRIARMST